MPTITAGTNSYVTLASASDYCENRGLTAWNDANDYDRETALLRGMVYIESKMYKGQKYSELQALKWPRQNATDEDNVAIATSTTPQAIKDAQCRAAYEELVSPGVLQPNLTRDSFTSREKVDVIDISYERGRNSTVFQVIDGYLRGYIMQTGRLLRC